VTTRLLFVCVVLAACSTPPKVTPSPAFDPVPWLEDLAQLEDALGQHYSNLEWNVRHRGLDAAALDRTARAELSRATNEREALEAVVRFVAGFRDPHLSWSLTRPRNRYDVRFTTDGSSVRIQRAGPGACGAQAGDAVESIQGLPAMEQLQARLPLSRLPTPAGRRDDALATLTSSVLAPADGLRFRFVHGDEARECAMSPLPPIPNRAPPPATIPADLPGEKACELLGYTPRSPPGSPLLFHPERHPNFTPSPLASMFGAGTVRLSSGKTLGWLRIPLFAEEAYPAFCAASWEKFRTTLKEPCGEQCQGDFDGAVLITGLVEAISKHLDAFRAAKVSGVVVDITDNGGGTDWVIDTARLLFSRDLSCAATARVREPAAAKDAQEDLKELSACGAPAADLEWVRAFQAEATQPCDWRGVFRGEAAPGCSMLTRSRRSTCRPSIGAGLKCAAVKPIPDDHRVHGFGGAPVYVLINRDTASAAEELTAAVRDSGAAILVGERTLGAGCGYVNGGNEVTLKRSAVKVRMPNCVRYRADGTNEIEGILPDVELPWTGDDVGRFESYAEKALAHADELFLRPSAR
jgi:hypothetical protein